VLISSRQTGAFVTRNNHRWTAIGSGLKPMPERQLAQQPDTDLLDDDDPGVDAVAKAVAGRMRLSGSSGKA